MPNVYVDGGYFRRWYGNFLATDNRALAPADFTGFSVTAPSDGRLPGGGGYPVSGLYNITQAGFTRPPDNYLTFAKDYGSADRELARGRFQCERAHARRRHAGRHQHGQQAHRQLRDSGGSSREQRL